MQLRVLHSLQLILLNGVLRFGRSSAALLIFSLIVLALAFYTQPFINYIHAGYYYLTSLPSLIYYDVCNAVVLFLMPAVFCKTVWRQKLSSIGLRLPLNNWLAFLLIVAALALLLPEIYYFSQLPVFKASHVFPKVSPINFFIANFLMLPIYYFCEEFFFRGFLFTGLWTRIKWHSFWVTDVIFTLAHMGKPTLEILLCIPASIIFNILTLYTKSFLPALIVHSTVGIALNIFVRLHT